jgi:hypothetical protein
MCLYEVAYDNGSDTMDHFTTEMLTLEDSLPMHDVVIHDNEGFFVRVVGLVVLDGGPLSFPS